ncbi:hypothetical protein [Candidatus Binatus sp.]|uniref:hypothetical protein n=1 Tax=Candidatus Binatus sp. TaxID=2811406 RepID=UPI003C4F10FA
MKLRVQHENGLIEILTLDGHWEIVEGTTLDRIRSDRGIEHFFTKDGFYDGWGSGLGEESGARADEIVSAMEQKREFDRD